MTSVQDKRVTVLGLGHFGGGIAVTRWLIDEGAASVTVCDQAPADKLRDSVEQLRDLNVTFHLGDQVAETDFTNTDLVVASPAVPPGSPLLAAARKANVEITTEICLFTERCPARVVAVTGTKGKSTTTALLEAMLATKYTAWKGGNIGKSLLADLPSIRKDHVVALELSSYMLHYLGEKRWRPDLAVVTLVTADHLDWHGGHFEYVDAKQNIVRYQTSTDVAVLCDENETSRDFAKLTAAKVILYRIDSAERFQLPIAGEHNQLNAQGAFAAAHALGVEWPDAQRAVGNFKGLPHRLELVVERDGVKYINDSIATIPEAAIAALKSFPHRRVIHIIGGSKKKEPPIEILCDELANNAKAVLTIGETGHKIAEGVRSHNNNAVRVEEPGDLTTAMQLARQLAQKGDVVLLSPAYPSYDQFINFEKRGELFSKLAKET